MKFLLLLITLMFVQSCVVLKEDYYFPSASGGNVEQEFCRGQVGADNVLVLDLQGVTAKFSVRAMGESLRFYVEIEVPKNAKVVWPTQNIIGQSDNGKIDLTIRSFARVVSRGANYKTAEYSTGTVMDNLSETTDVYFESVSFTENQINLIEIEKLHLIVDGQDVTLPAMKFQKASGFYLHPLNC